MANGADHPLAGRSGGGFSRQVDTPRAGRRCSPPAGRIWCPNLVPLLRRGVSIADRMDGILGGTIGLRFPSRRRCGCEAWRRMAGNLAAISAIRPVKIRTAEIAIGPVATRPAQIDLRNDLLCEPNSVSKRPPIQLWRPDVNRIGRNKGGIINAKYGKVVVNHTAYQTRQTIRAE